MSQFPDAQHLASWEHPNHNTLHAQPASLTSFHLAKDVSKLAKFLNVLSVPRQRQQFVVPNDVQVIFILGLRSRQNESAFVRLAVCSTYLCIEFTFMVRCGSKSHGLFIAQAVDGVELGGEVGGIVAEEQADGNGHDKADGDPGIGQRRRDGWSCGAD
jgi:hypothetical protein